MGNCKYFDPKKKGCKVNCANCTRWNGEACNIMGQILLEYEESNEYREFDRMMRDNHGIRLE